MPHPNELPDRKTKRRRSRLVIAGVTVAAAATAVGIAGAQAFTPAHVKHFVDCFGWMITDPDTHAENCLPGYMPPPGSLSSPGDGPDHPPDFDLDSSQDDLSDSFQDN